ncbi:MAG: insulinase family protein [Treponema sp.]|jgi:zinc protease|nr:insulinase family protein [Treponema sp.]
MKKINFYQTLGIGLLLAGLLILPASFTGCAGIPKFGASAYGNLGKPSDPIPFPENCRTGVLSSGLRYYILENSRPADRAYLTLAVKAGSVLETGEEQGLAHFVEHMAFNGTARFPEAELVNYLRSLGMRFGPEVNAYTSYDETVYGIEVPVETGAGGEKRVPVTALAVIDDWTRAVTFAPRDVDDERPVIMEEYRSRLGAMDRIQRQMLPVLFEGSPYANRLPIGLPEIIESAPASRIEDFYRKWYRADNMALIFVGDFDGAALEASLEQHFSIAKPANALDRPVYDLPAPKRGNVKSLILADPELTSLRVDMYFKRGRETPRNDLARFRNEIIDTLIDRMLGFRFDDAAMKSETPYIDAGAGNIRYGASSRFYIMAAQAKSGAAEACLAELLREKESLLRYGFTEAELSLARNSLISDLQRAVSEKDRQESGGHVNNIISHYLRGESFADVEWELEGVRQLLPHIGVRETAAAVKSYFNSGELCVFISAPEAEKEGLPSEERVRQLVKESSKFEIAPPESSVVGNEVLPFIPAGGYITEETRDEESGAVVLKLGNGARVILKETGNRNNEIILQAMARGGSTSVPPEDDVSADLAAEMVAVSGLGPYSRPELTKKIAAKQVSLASWISDYHRGLRGSATAGDLKTLFEMIYLSFTEPRIDPEAVKVMMEQYRTSLALRNESPDTFFFDEVSKTIYGNNPRLKPVELADLSKVDIDRALSFVKRGLNPADYTFVFTGNLDAGQIRSYIESYLGSIPEGTENFNTWTNPGITRPGGTEKNIYKGKEERGLVYMGWFTKQPYTEELSAAAQVLTEYLDIRMTEEIREKLGGVYSISVGVSASPIPDGELIMTIYFACDPGRVKELSAAVQELLGRTAGQGAAADGAEINQDTFEKSVEALKKEWEASIQNNSYIAQSYVNSSVLLNLPLSRLDKRPAYYSAVTPADIRALCARLLQRGPVQVTLYPEK